MNRTTHTTLFGLCVILLASSVSGCHEERNQSIRLMNEGLKLVKRDRMGEAVKTFAEAAQVDPTNDRARYYQGMVLAQKLDS